MQELLSLTQFRLAFLAYCQIIKQQKSYRKMIRTYLSDLITQVGELINRPYSDLQQYQTKLSENWFDTPQAIGSMTDSDFESLKIPKRMANAIRELTSASKPKPKVQQPQMQPVTDRQTYEELSEYFLLGLKDQTLNNKSLILQKLRLLATILVNLIDHPEEIKFRKVKCTGKKFTELIGSSETCSHFLTFIGFLREGDELVLQVYDDHHLRECLVIVEQSKIIIDGMTDPYQSNCEKEENKQSKQEKSEIDKIKEKIQEFKKQKLTIKPTDRKMRVYHKIYEHKSAQNVKSLGQYLLFCSENDPKAAELLSLVESIDRSNKLATLQIDLLLSQPFASEAIVKIRLPNDCILQGVFGPKELVRDVVQFAKQNSLGDHYIFTRPPVVYMNKHLDKTLQEMNAVPDGQFYLGSVCDLWQLKEEVKKKFKEYLGEASR